MKLSNNLRVQCNRVGFKSWMPMHSLKSAFKENGQQGIEAMTVKQYL